jgi:parallel beta-helix repeat protein
MKKILLFIALIANNTLAQTTYYVNDALGNDSNLGTTLTNAWATIQHAADNATPNSIVYIKGGTYNENIYVNVTGTAGNTITFRNYQNDVVIIDGTGTTDAYILYVENQSYLNFENLIIQNKIMTDAQGVVITATGASSVNQIYFKNITIKNIGWTTNATALPNSTNNAQALVAAGAQGGIKGLFIDSCKIYNNILGYSEAVSIDGNVDGFSITNCEVYDNTNIGIDIIGNYLHSPNPSTDHARHGIVSHNKCYRNKSLVAESGGIYVDGGHNILVEYNQCYENGYGIELGCEENGTTDSIMVRNNIIYNNNQTGISVGGYTTATTGQVLNSTIRNNTLYSNNTLNNGTGEIVMSKASNCVFENNIIYADGQDVLMSVDNILPQNNNIFNYNCWYTPSNNQSNVIVNWRGTTYNSFLSYKNSTGNDANSLFINPQMVSATNYNLQSSSPCINTGKLSTVIAIGETDFAGNARLLGSNIDIGAYEYTSIVNATEAYKAQDLSIYPNPNSGTMQLINMDKNYTIHIYNLLGTLVFTSIDSYNATIHHNLNKGTYFMQCIDDTTIITTLKMVVN